jgi:cysteine desulfurase
VLTAIGLAPELARGSLRLSLARTTTDAEIDRAADVIPATIERLAAARSRVEAVA